LVTALISGQWGGWWIYWIGPVAGALLAIAAHRAPTWRRASISVAKMHHFGHDPRSLFDMSCN